MSHPDLWDVREFVEVDAWNIHQPRISFKLQGWIGQAALLGPALIYFRTHDRDSAIPSVGQTQRNQACLLVWPCADTRRILWLDATLQTPVFRSLGSTRGAFPQTGKLWSLKGQLRASALSWDCSVHLFIVDLEARGPSSNVSNPFVSG